MSDKYKYAKVLKRPCTFHGIIKYLSLTKLIDCFIGISIYSKTSTVFADKNSSWLIIHNKRYHYLIDYLIHNNDVKCR